MTPEINIPQAENLEKAVIGALVMEPGYLPEVANILSPECFFNEANAEIFRNILLMYDHNEQIDLFTLSQRCKGNKTLAGINIPATLTACTAMVGSGAGVVSHAQIIREKHLARQMIVLTSKVLNGIQHNEDVATTLQKFNEGMDQIAMAAIGSKGAQPIGKLLDAALQQAKARQQMQRQGITPGVPTGLARLDELTAGWHAGQLIVLAARPGMGKTAFMLASAKAAAQAGYPPCIYSLEMSGTSIADRLLFTECQVSLDSYRSGKLDRQDWTEIERAAQVVGKLPIYIDDNPVVSMRYIRSHAKIMAKRGRCGIIFIDYLQLADTASADRTRNREQEIAQASRQAKIIAKELEVPVVLLSQLSRKCEERAGAAKMPLLSDLRESGAIEQDADVVGFIFRPAYYGIREWPTDNGSISTNGFGILNIAKQRNGGTEEIPFRYNPSLTLITDYTLYDNAPKRDVPF